MSAEYEVKFLGSTHSLTRFCIPEELNASVGEYKIQNNNFNLGEALQSHYPLLELVFRFLDEKTLKIVLAVNDAWQDSAQKELNKRTWPTWITYNNCPKATLFLSKGFNFNHVALSLFAYNQTRIKLDKQLCVHLKSGERKVTFTDYLDDVASEHYCAIACRAVSPIIDLCDSVFQGVFIPHIPHIRTTMFEFNHSKPDLTAFINEEEEVKACLIFTKKYNARSIEAFFQSLLKGQSHKDVAMGGGIINCKKSLKMPENRRLRDQNLLCIAFLQEAECNFKAYSAVIVNEREDSDGFADELVRFKATTTVLYKYGIVFRFCCSAKVWKSEETDLIYRFFPNYIVFGMDVDGEIGWNTFDVPENEEYPQKKKRKKSFPATLNGWTSVLVLITWGNKIKNLQ
ncbi:hypothetical protein RN001_015133 [Aquatica leii]|uniref:Uncharacterized protein n=1 Tax=Aquatica leii TaxID=1421715 RepID=A0AAN7SC89_9COLE|nr:hypothetical protein RN001_015133 [Aquatica leii]